MHCMFFHIFTFLECESLHIIQNKNSNSQRVVNSMIKSHIQGFKCHRHPRNTRNKQQIFPLNRFFLMDKWPAKLVHKTVFVCQPLTGLTMEHLLKPCTIFQCYLFNIWLLCVFGKCTLLATWLENLTYINKCIPCARTPCFVYTACWAICAITCHANIFWGQ